MWSSALLVGERFLINKVNLFTSGLLLFHVYTPTICTGSCFTAFSCVIRLALVSGCAHNFETTIRLDTDQKLKGIEGILVMLHCDRGPSGETQPVARIT
jgi:hypothetical protein